MQAPHCLDYGSWDHQQLSDAHKNMYVVEDARLWFIGEASEWYWILYKELMSIPGWKSAETRNVQVYSNNFLKTHLWRS